MEPTIALATLADLEPAALLLRAQFAEHALALDDATVRAGLAGLLAHSELGAVLLARAHETPLGLAVLATTWTLEHGGLVAWLDELYVVPPQRGHGLGERLARAALAHARQLGCHAVELEVDADHERASHLYARLGFAPLARRRWALTLTPPT